MCKNAWFLENPGESRDSPWILQGTRDRRALEACAPLGTRVAHAQDPPWRIPRNSPGIGFCLQKHGRFWNMFKHIRKITHIPMLFNIVDHFCTKRAYFFTKKLGKQVNYTI